MRDVHSAWLCRGIFKPGKFQEGKENPLKGKLINERNSRGIQGDQELAVWSGVSTSAKMWYEEGFPPTFLIQEDLN